MLVCLTHWLFSKGSNETCCKKGTERAFTTHQWPTGASHVHTYPTLFVYLHNACCSCPKGNLVKEDGVLRPSFCKQPGFLKPKPSSSLKRLAPVHEENMGELTRLGVHCNKEISFKVEDEVGQII
ncbi:hypothetical protein V6N12_006812 [Hibiscus sabdariffa]|uniref:Uncharacterized protein n=1 Tax=Hibiscus sabdariffa TaxID=183260 RepID=A0ABR2EZZ6_9ROSI